MSCDEAVSAAVDTGQTGLSSGGGGRGCSLGGKGSGAKLAVPLKETLVAFGDVKFGLSETMPVEERRVGGTDAG